MKLVSFSSGHETGFGFVDQDHLVPLKPSQGCGKDLKSHLADIIKDIVAMGCTGLPRGAALPLASVCLLPPVPNPHKIFCVATNFDEPSRAKRPAPEYPLLFTRCAESLVGHGTALLKPAVSEAFDFEGELAVIIAAHGHKIPISEAMSYVAGYCCLNDGSVRDWQKHSTQFTPGKNFYRSGSMGPWLVTRDEVPSPASLHLETRVNGIIKQSIGMDRMIFNIAWLIAYISTFAPLAPGDVIATGTPSGFGSTRTPAEFLHVGDDIEITISGIGTLHNTVQQDSDPRPPLFS